MSEDSDDDEFAAPTPLIENNNDDDDEPPAAGVAVITIESDDSPSVSQAPTAEPTHRAEPAKAVCL
jgi:hypothetical protein